MSNKDAGEIQSLFLKGVLTAALANALIKLANASGPHAEAVLAEFRKGMENSIKNSTPEGPTTEAGLKAMVDEALDVTSQIFAIIKRA